MDLLDLHGIPVYDGDLEQQGFPPAVTALKERLAGADGVILGSPEYNAGVPGALKNAIDWCSRPSSDIARTFGDKPWGIVGASAGPGATRLGQTAWLPTMRLLGVRLFPDALYVANAGQVLVAPADISDPQLAERAKRWMAKFITFAGI